jgi:F1F0 ATPase subunit 2
MHGIGLRESRKKLKVVKMINEVSALIFGLTLGVGLGIFFFGGLWLTLGHLLHSQHPGLLTLSSFLVRSMVCLFIFYLMVSNSLAGLAASLAGFILAKMILTYRLGTLHLR